MTDVNEVKRKVDEHIRGKVTPEHTEYKHFYKYVPTGEIYPSVTTRSGIVEKGYLKDWAAKLAVNHIKEVIEDGRIFDWDELKEEALQQHHDVLDDAGTIGTIGHDAIENYLIKWLEDDEQPDDIREFIEWQEGYEEDPRAYAIVRSAEEFINNHHVIPIAPELRVVNERYEYGGMLDLLAKVAEVKKPGDKDCQHNFLVYSRSRDIHECGRCGRRIRYHLTLVDWKTSNSVMKDEYAMQVSAYWYALKEMANIKPSKIWIVQLDKKSCKYKIVEPTHRPSAFKAFRDIGKVYDWLEDGEDKIEKVDKREQVKLFDTSDDSDSSGLTEI